MPHALRRVVAAINICIKLKILGLHKKGAVSYKLKEGQCNHVFLQATYCSICSRHNALSSLSVLIHQLQRIVDTHVFKRPVTFRKKVLKCWPASAAQQTAQTIVCSTPRAATHHPLPSAFPACPCHENIVAALPGCLCRCHWCHSNFA